MGVFEMNSCIYFYKVLQQLLRSTKEFCAKPECIGDLDCDAKRVSCKFHNAFFLHFLYLHLGKHNV